MAEWLPAGIGLMAGVCAFGLLGVARARGATYGPWLSGAPHNVRAFVLEAARRLGDAVPAALANWPVLRSCADEMRHISVLTRWVMRDARVERRRTRRPMRASADGPNQGNGSLAREERPTSARTGVSALPREALDDVACRGLFLMADALCGMAGAVIALSPLGLVVGAGAPWLLFSARAARRARAAVRKVEAEMPEAFDALAFNFIKKPIDNQRFQAIIEKAICFIEANKKKFCFTQNNSKKSILCSDIYYFESEKRKMIVYCVTQTFCFYSSVKQVLEQLDSTIFNQTHASYIVNMNFIDTIYREHLLLTNGKEIPISKKYKKSLMDGYHFFLRRRL